MQTKTLFHIIKHNIKLLPIRINLNDELRKSYDIVNLKLSSYNENDFDISGGKKFQEGLANLESTFKTLNNKANTLSGALELIEFADNFPTYIKSLKEETK